MKTAVVCLASALMIVVLSSLSAQESSSTGVVQGFLEPYRTIRVASVESGVLKRLHVEEGNDVKEGQPLAELDTSIYNAMLEIAKANRDARGDLDLARTEQRLQQHRLDLFLQLYATSHANEEETRRARTELEVAAAQVRSAEERKLARKLEFERLAAQLEARTIRAPQDGVVTAIQKQCGEYVGPTDPVLLTMVQLQPLSAVFLVPRQQVARLNVGQSVSLVFPGAGLTTEGTIEFIAPVVDAGSGTIAVRVRVDNTNRSLRAGEPCQFVPHGLAPTAQGKVQRMEVSSRRQNHSPEPQVLVNPFRSVTKKASGIAR